MRTTPITVTTLHLWRISLISAYVTIQFVSSEKYGSLGIQNHLTTKQPTCTTMEIAIRMNPMMFVVVIVYLSFLRGALVFQNELLRIGFFYTMQVYVYLRQVLTKNGTDTVLVFFVSGCKHLRKSYTADSGDIISASTCAVSAVSLVANICAGMYFISSIVLSTTSPHPSNTTETVTTARTKSNL